MEALNLERFKEFAKTVLNECRPLQKKQYSIKVIEERVGYIKYTLDSSHTVDIDTATRKQIIQETIEECRDIYLSQPPMFKKEKAFSKS